MPPFSPATYGSLPNSMKLFWPGKPCHPSTPTQGGSTRPEDNCVEHVVANGAVVAVVQALGGSLLPIGFRRAALLPTFLLQSASAQYTAPGTRRLVGTETTSAVFARNLPIVEFPHGG